MRPQRRATYGIPRYRAGGTARAALRGRHYSGRSAPRLNSTPPAFSFAARRSDEGGISLRGLHRQKRVHIVKQDLRSIRATIWNISISKLDVEVKGVAPENFCSEEK